MTDYIPHRSQPIATVRKPASNPPPFVYPDTPPATPPPFHRSTFDALSKLEKYGHYDNIDENGAISMPSASTSSPHHGQQRQRHSVSQQSHFITVPSPTDSPLALPTLLSDDEDMSPSSSTGILTPPVISVSGDEHPRIITEHSMLQALSGDATPPMSHLEGFDRRGSYPLLSPQHARSQKWAEQTRDISPPSTPKGHPVSQFSFATRKIAITKNHLIAQPSLARKITYLVKVPRRYRPAFILCLCLLTFLALYISRSLSVAHELQATHGRTYLKRSIATLTEEQRQHLALMQREQQLKKAAGGKQLKFKDVSEEFAAVVSFITSTTTSLLPAVDPSKPLEPGLILDFDPTSPRAREDLELIMTEIHAMYPLIIFGKMRDPWHREVKKMLAEYKITPAPLIIELDQRPDAATFIPLLARLLGSPELPQMTLQGKSIGGYHDVLEMREKGTFKEMLESSGAVMVKAAKKTKKGRKELERLENEKVLAPRPIVDGI